MSRIINQNTEPLFIFDMPDDETLSETISVKGEKGERGDPTKLSDLENDEGFITVNTDELANYYTKTATDNLLNTKLDKSTFNALEMPTDFFTGDETVSGSGSSISLSNTVEAVFKTIAFYGDATQSSTPTTSDPVDVQVVTGDQTITITDNDLQSTAYALSLGDIELCKIGNYQDFIYKDDDDWYLHKVIAKTTLDKLTWTNEASASARRYRSTSLSSVIAPISNNNQVGAIRCSHYKASTVGDTWTGVNCVSTHTNNSVYLYDADFNTTTSLGDFQTWLSTNKPVFYYALATASDTKIEDIKLIRQLDAISRAKSSDGSTIISVTGSLPVLVSVAAFRGGWNGAVSGINNSIDTANNRIERAKAKLEEVEYIFPKDWRRGTIQSGDCGLIKGYGVTILIDTAYPTYADDVYDFLDSENVSHIDYLILSHYHSDHAGNVTNLFNAGYINSDTIMYLPPSCNLVQNDNDQSARYTEVHNLATNNDITVVTPTEGSRLSIDKDFNIYFYNSDVTALNAFDTTDSNNASMVCLLVHGGKKVLYTGDANRIPLDRLVDEGFIDSGVDLYKIEHHAINWNSESYIPRKLLYATKPTYAYAPANSICLQQNNISVSLTASYLKAFGTKLYAQLNNSASTKFISTVDNIQPVSGMPLPSISNAPTYASIYVDASTTKTKFDGSADYPFKDLSQAIGYCQAGTERVVIYLADGTYNASHPNNASKDIPRFINCNITIMGNAEDNTAVVINNGFLAFSSYITVKNCTVTSTLAQECIYVENCNLRCENCVISSSLTTITAELSGIQSFASNLILLNCTFSHLNLGVSTHEDNIKAKSCTFTDMARAIYLRNTTLDISSCTYSSITSGRLYFGRDSSVIMNPVVLKTLNDTSGTITLNDDITEYNKLIIQTWGSDGLYTDEIRSYAGSSFTKGSTYKCKSISNTVTITVDSNDGTKLTYTSPDALRRIYGVVEYKEG